MMYVKGAPNAWHTTVPPEVLVLSFPLKKKRRECDTTIKSQISIHTRSKCTSKGVILSEPFTHL